MSGNNLFSEREENVLIVGYDQQNQRPMSIDLSNEQ